MNKKSLHNESEVLARTAGGDEQAFSMLFDHYRSFIYSFVLRITGDDFTASEIVQDTFLKVWLKRSELTTVHNFTGWIYIVAERFTYSALTKTNREKSYFDEWLAAAEYSKRDEDGNRYMEEIDYQAVLNTAVNRLSPKQKETYLLIKEQGLQRTAAARILNVSPETVKWNLEQAMSSIRAFCILRLKDQGSSMFLLLLLEIYF